MTDQPINPVDYVPSKQVRLLVEMINNSRQGYGTIHTRDQQRFKDGTRYGLDLAFRALVELETKITDPDDLDQLCGDLIEDDLADGRAG